MVCATAAHVSTLRVALRTTAPGLQVWNLSAQHGTLSFPLSRSYISGVGGDDARCEWLAGARAKMQDAHIVAASMA
jgi:hypothetical protein